MHRSHILILPVTKKAQTFNQRFYNPLNLLDNLPMTGWTIMRRILFMDGQPAQKNPPFGGFFKSVFSLESF